MVFLPAGPDETLRLATVLTTNGSKSAYIALMPRYVGKVCSKHPELQGERRNGNCPACETERRRTPAYRKRHRAWHKANPDVHRKSVTSWRAANHEAFVAGKLARNAVRRARTGPVSAEVRRAWIALSRKAKRLGATVDHIVPLAGCRVCGTRGKHEPRNWRLLTGSENASKGNRCQACWR
jgi:hypothetical protein